MTTLSSLEQEWANYQPWLLSRGYQLRARFQPGWVASWVTHPVKHFTEMDYREDYLRQCSNPVMDAVRLSDNKQVMLKRIFSREHYIGREHDVSEFAASEEQLQDPTNHCVPLLEILPVPGDNTKVIIVMPLLRRWRSPRFDTIGEAVDMFRQAFEGLQYLHRNHIAHRDCTDGNLMMEGTGMYPEGFHPIKYHHNREFTGPALRKYTRTQCPPQYYWLDFGLSVPFLASEDHPRAIPVKGGDKSAPEHREIYNVMVREPIDPFPTDIYYLGNFLRVYFTEGCTDFDYKLKYGFGFLKPLVEVMVQDDPQMRPNIDECVAQLEEIIQSLSSWTLRSQVWYGTDNPIGFAYRFFPHWARRIVYIITRTPAIPDRSRPPSPHLPLYTNIVLIVWAITFFVALLYYLK